MSTRPALTIGALALVAGLVVGCGGSDSSDSADNPEEAVQAFYDAARNNDAEAICATLSAATLESSAEQSGSCENQFQDTFGSAGSVVPPGLTIDSSSIEGDTATVDVTTGNGEKNTFTLVNEDGWKLDLVADDGGDSSTGVTDSTTG